MPCARNRVSCGIRRTACVLSAVIAAAGLAACDEQLFDPFSNDGKYFTVYGFLESGQTQQVIRVIPITRRGSDVTDPKGINADIDARVTTTESTTGRQVIWTHSLEQLADGTYGHIYRGAFVPQPGRSYELRVERRDGMFASAATTVPIIAEPPLLNRSGVYISPDSSVVSQEIVAPGVASPWGIEVTYRMQGATFNTFIIKPYGRTGERLSDGSWKFTIQLSEDQEYVSDQIRDIYNQGFLEEGDRFALTAVGVRFHILDQGWDPPGGEFDFEAIAEPGTVSNVENGFGFFGSVGEYIEEWPAGELSQLLGHS